jgi:hypothetical protein
MAGVKVDTQHQAPAIDVRTQYPGFAVWLHEQLGWLANDIYQLPRESPRTPQYRVRTKTHPELSRFASWPPRASGDPRPALPGLLALRTFVARAAAVASQSGARTTQFHAEHPTVRDWYHAELADRGYDPVVTDRGVRLSTIASRQLFDDIGPPVPGVEHKWRFDMDAYRDQRRDQRVDQLGLALRPPHAGSFGPHPSAWDRKYSERTALMALRTADSDTDATMYVHEYKTWLQNTAGTPSYKWYQDNGGFDTWAELAAVEVRARPGGAKKAPSEFIPHSRADIRIAITDTSARWGVPVVKLSANAYQRGRLSYEPPLRTISAEFGDWQTAKTSAKHTTASHTDNA